MPYIHSWIYRYTLPFPIRSYLFLSVPICPFLLGTHPSCCQNEIVPQAIHNYILSYISYRIRRICSYLSGTHPSCCQNKIVPQAIHNYIFSYHISIVSGVSALICQARTPAAVRTKSSSRSPTPSESSPPSACSKARNMRSTSSTSATPAETQQS
jgi:hypothetical protein